jgi:hypothetical protein
LLYCGAFVTVSHLYQHCIADANSLVTGCEVCQSLAGTSVNPAPAVDPVVVLFRRQSENLAVQTVEAELPNSASLSPPQY